MELDDNIVKIIGIAIAAIAGAGLLFKFVSTKKSHNNNSINNSNNDSNTVKVKGTKIKGNFTGRDSYKKQ